MQKKCFSEVTVLLLNRVMQCVKIRGTKPSPEECRNEDSHEDIHFTYLQTLHSDLWCGTGRS